MKKITKYLLLIIFTILPLYSVSAYEITCDEGNHEFEEFFYCRLNGVTIGEEYDTLSGTITNNEYVSCLRYSDGSGLVNQNPNDYKALSYVGKPTSQNISTFRCQVIKKAEEAKQVQIFINDFKSHTKTQVGNPTEEIIRSNYINIPKYIEKTTTAPTKPRDTSNSNSRLKALAEEHLNITFSGFITEYNAEVLYEVDKLDIKIIPFNSNASTRIVGNYQNLSVGLNVIDIYVMSPDGASTTCYTLNVTRLKEGESIYYPESDASLKNLTVTGYTIGFKPEVSEYRLHLDNKTSKVEVNAIPNVDTATVNISNTSNLQNGSVISVTITSEDLSNETKYKIIITKDAPKKDYTPYIILGVLVILGIIVVIIIIHTNKKNKKDPLLRLKNDKRKVNYGKKNDPNAIPEAENAPVQPIDQQEEDNNSAPNVIKADSVNVVQPLQMTEKVVDTNLNKISSNTNALDLSVSAKAMPQAMPNPTNPANQVNPVNPVNQVSPVNQVNTLNQQPSIQSTQVNALNQQASVQPTMVNNTISNQVNSMPNNPGIIQPNQVINPAPQASLMPTQQVNPEQPNISSNPASNAPGDANNSGMIDLGD